MSTQDIETYKHMVRGKSVDFDPTAPAPAAAPTPEPGELNPVHHRGKLLAALPGVVAGEEAVGVDEVFGQHFRRPQRSKGSVAAYLSM